MTLGDALLYLSTHNLVCLDCIRDLYGISTIPKSHDRLATELLDLEMPEKQGLLLFMLREAVGDATICVVPQLTEIGQHFHWRMKHLVGVNLEDWLVESPDPRNQMGGVIVGLLEGDALALAVSAFAVRHRHTHVGG